MTYEEFKQETAPFFGQLVLNHYEVMLLKDTSEDEYDYYYVFARFSGKRIHATAVGTFYPLKGVLPDKQYNELVRVWNLNHSKEHHAI